MFYGNEVQDTRQMFFTSWQKHLQKAPLLPLEKQIVQVILEHPEYQTMLNSPKGPLDQTYFPELGQTNPFLHMGLHLAIRDQLSIDRPAGICQAYKQLLDKYIKPLAVEHLMMEALVESLWQAQRTNSLPDELAYLSAVQRLL